MLKLGFGQRVWPNGPLPAQEERVRGAARRLHHARARQVPHLRTWCPSIFRLAPLMPTHRSIWDVVGDRRIISAQ